ncbi:MAG: hypothetical protein IPH11_04870 [Ignavibacteriales bacterium]|nr:hypothetical protein [Ignavibacteriales bacterium]
MKAFLKSIPNKIKAIYLLWFTLHLVLLLINWSFTGSNYLKYFYPFSKGAATGEFILTFPDSFPLRMEQFDLRVYDYSEFIIYLIAPVVIYLFIYLWRKKD